MIRELNMSIVAYQALPVAPNLSSSEEEKKGNAQEIQVTEDQVSESVASRFQRGGEEQAKDELFKEKIRLGEQRKIELQDKLRLSLEGTDEYKRNLQLY